MKDAEVHDLIREKIEETEEEDLEQFLNDLLEWERSKMDLDEPQYSEPISRFVDKHTGNEELTEYNQD